MADDQENSKPLRSNTSELDEGSFNEVQIRPTSAKEMTAARKSEIREDMSQPT
jgi:hypothetical protein